VTNLHHVFVYPACVNAPCVTAYLRTPAKVERAVVAQSTIHPDGTYVVPASLDMLTLTPSVTARVNESQRKYK
jgi:hypothetical protein